jgi:hypothetical protein
MWWVIGILVAIALAVLISLFGTQNSLERKAAKMSKGSEEDRQTAAEMREISRKIDQGKYLYR